MDGNQGKVCPQSFLCILMQPYIFSFSPGIDKRGQGGGDGCRERQRAGGAIDRVWVEPGHLLGVGEIEVETKRQVHGGVECMG